MPDAEVSQPAPVPSRPLPLSRVASRGCLKRAKVPDQDLALLLTLNVAQMAGVTAVIL
jgi:hypothetical protein